VTTILVRLSIAYASVAAALLAIGALVPIQGGPLAIASILAPHFALACVALVPMAIVARSRQLAIALGLVAFLFAARFAGEWVSPLPSDEADALAVATWNTQAGVAAADETVRMLVDRSIDIVTLQELTPEVAAAIDVDPILMSRYSHQALEARPGVSGVGILSRFPISTAQYATEPVRLEVRVTLPDRELVVLVAHPFPARIGLVAGMPADFDPAERNRELRLLRARVAALEAAGDSVLLIGDFNTAPTELAFGPLTAGLHDAHAEAGLGPGWTWRPAQFAITGIALLRIDLVLSTAALRPVRTEIGCPALGDHCLLTAWLAIAE
jgi:vancomycin resistance protein VanJ